MIKFSVLGTIEICLSLVIAILINAILRSLIKIPKQLDTKRGKTYVAVVRSLITIIIFALELNFIFIVLGIDLGPLLASAGIIGIALGIGARSLFEDLIAGFFLLTQSKIAIGDYVSFGTVEGVITDINFRTVTFTSPDGALNFMPNGQIKQVVNYSRGRAIVNVEIAVKGGQDISKIQDVLAQALDEMKEDREGGIIIHDASTVQGLQDVKPGPLLLFLVSIATANSSREAVKQEYLLRVVEAFKIHKITFG